MLRMGISRLFFARSIADENKMEADDQLVYQARIQGVIVDEAHTVIKCDCICVNQAYCANIFR